MNHLLDADPASNTLSWRWVAGLHTKNKQYITSAENIKSLQIINITQKVSLILTLFILQNGKTTTQSI